MGIKDKDRFKVIQERWLEESFKKLKIQNPKEQKTSEALWQLQKPKREL